VNRESAFVRARYSSPEKLRAYLDNLVRFEVLAREAEQRGYADDPDIIRIFKQQMVARLMQKDFEPRFDPAHFTEEELRARWEQNPREFHDPPKVRVSHILVNSKERGEEVAEMAKALDKGDQAGWGELVRNYSLDIASRQMNGDLGYQTPGKNVREKEVLLAAFSLDELGQVAGPIPSPRGFHVIRLTGRQPPKERSFEDVTKDTLDDYMESVQPGMTFMVEDKLNPEGGQKLGVNLSFRKMEDLEPAEIAKQVPALKKLLDARMQLANLAKYMASKPAAQGEIKKLLDDPELLKTLADRVKDEPEDNGGDTEE